jgi:hypothetical protein
MVAVVLLFLINQSVELSLMIVTIPRFTTPPENFYFLREGWCVKNVRYNIVVLITRRRSLYNLLTIPYASRNVAIGVICR